jgi:multiple sugar transport system substrate-binding protein/putative aldouronate transport system substrate-binding protein
MKHIGKSAIGIVMAVAMLATVASCSKTNSSSTATASANPSSAASTASGTSSAGSTSSASNLPLLKIDWFDGYGNLLNGLSQGWWANEVKQKFNIQINMICPNVAGGGDQLYQTRTAAGYLADIFDVGNAQFGDMIKAGLVMDITSEVQNATNLQKYDLSIKNTCATLGTGDKIYAIPSNSSLSPPTTPNLDGGNLNYGPYMRWDYYKELGYPDMKNYTDMLNVLKQMQTNHPKSTSGKKVYGISLFKDWDGGSSAFVSWFCTFYGYNPVGYLFLNHDASQYIDITNTTGPYYKGLQMIYQANQMGLLDPDAPTNTWNSLAAKIQDGQVLWQPWPWNTVDSVNTPDLGAKTQGWALVPTDDMSFLAQGLNPYGQGSSFGIDAHDKNAQRLVDLLDWYGSPEGMWFSANGPEGLCWDMQGGKPTLTDYGKTTAIKAQGQAPVPAQYGGGDYVAGSNPINAGIGMTNDIDPTYNEPYAHSAWSTTVAANQTALTQDWNTHYSATSVLDYLQSNNKLVVFPGNSYSTPAESSTVQTEDTQCGTVIKTASWQMMYAKNQSQFDSIWANMMKELPGLGYQDVLKTQDTWAAGYKAGIAQALAATGTGS